MNNFASSSSKNEDNWIQCCCNKNDDAKIVYGKVYHILCFVHHCITPQGMKFLSKLPSEIYPFGVVGMSRSGKSYLLNAIASVLYGYFMNAPSLQKDIYSVSASDILDVFPESNESKPCTKGIQIMAIPRFCDESSKQIQSASGIYIIIDAEGQDLGNTLNHEAILGIMSRIVTHLNFIEPGQFNFGAIRSLGRLVASNLIINNEGKNKTTVWPQLSIVINKYSLVPIIDLDEYIKEQLKESKDDLSNNLDREVVRNTWSKNNKLGFHTIPADPISLMNPEAVKLLSPNAIAAIRKDLKQDIENWIISSIKRTNELSPSFIFGINGQGHISGLAYANFIDGLIHSYKDSKNIDYLGAFASAIQQKCKECIDLAIKYYQEKSKIESYLLIKGRDDIDGARGTKDDKEANKILEDIHNRHALLSKICQDDFNKALNDYIQIASNKIIQDSLARLINYLEGELNEIDRHWKHMRTFDDAKTETEHSSKDSEPVRELSHSVTKRKLGIKVGNIYYYNTFVNRTILSRNKFVRNNGDICYSAWVESAPIKVKIDGPRL